MLMDILEKLFYILVFTLPFVFGFMSLLSWFQMRDGMCALYGLLCIVNMGFDILLLS